MMRNLIISMRPKQWVKNFFILMPLVFSENLFDFPVVSKAMIAFGLFCLLSGCVYIINDTGDLEKDRLHPIKKSRPIASGELNASHAAIFAACLILTSIGLAFSLDRNFGYIACLYFLLNVAYSFFLKNVVLLDVFIIASGFCLRVIGGAEVIDVHISSWLLVCTMLLSLFLAFAKRRHELVILDSEAERHREILAEYNPYFLDQMISVVTASTVISYLMYTVSEETVRKFNTRYLILTVPFVLYGVFRYLYLIHRREGGGSPSTELLNDRPLLITMILWTVTAGVIIYL